jgi:MoaA/NifB/PqqE/SkfB family radical SAM enzyme
VKGVADLPPYYESLMRFYTHQPRQHNHGRAFSPGAAIVFPNFEGRFHRSFTGYPAHELDPAPRPMTADAFKRTLDALPRRALLQVSGGIPLSPRWMRRALGSAARDRRVSLLTNGQSLLPDDAALVTARAANGLVSPGMWEVGLTLFGDEEQHDETAGHPGTYAAAVEELGEIRSQRKRTGARYPQLNLRFLLSPDSIAGLPSAWAVARDLRLDTFTMVLEDRGPWFDESSEQGLEVMERSPRKFPRGFAREAAAQAAMAISAGKEKHMPFVRITQGVDSPGEVKAYFENARDPAKYECPLPWFWVMVDPAGDAYLCPRYKVGNLHEEGMAEVWNGGRARAFRKLLKARGSFPACAGCPGLRLKKAKRGVLSAERAPTAGHGRGRSKG